MRQLDLFGSFIDTLPVKENTGEKPPVSIEKEAISSVSQKEEIIYSLVDLAEEMLGANTFNDSTETIESATTNQQPAERSEQESTFSFSKNQVIKEAPAALTIAEELEIELPVHNTGVRPEVGSKKQKDENAQFVRNGEVIFKNDLIAVKIKNKFTNPSADTGAVLKKTPQKRGRKSLQEIESEADLIEVPEDEELFKKQYYSISEVAKWFRVNNSLLRFWENEFDILKPKKNGKGDRLFRPEDVKNLQLIYQLLRQRKYTIEGAKEYLKTNKKKADIQLQLTNTLQKCKSFLLDLKANLHASNT